MNTNQVTPLNTLQRRQYQPHRFCAPDLPGEIWKQIPNVDTRFEVSNLGRLRSAVYSDVPGVVAVHPAGRILKTSPRKDGLLGVTVKSYGKLTYLRPHRVVAKLFVPNPKGFTSVRHKDGDKSNNRADNLVWFEQWAAFKPKKVKLTRKLLPSCGSNWNGFLSQLEETLVASSDKVLVVMIDQSSTVLEQVLINPSKITNTLTSHV